MKELLGELLEKYNKECIRLEDIKLVHGDKGCWCETCSDAHVQLDILTQVFNDLVLIYNKIK